MFLPLFNDVISTANREGIGNVFAVRLHKEPVSNSKHASIAQNGPTTVDEVWMWSWPNLRYYEYIEIRKKGPRKPTKRVSVYCQNPTGIRTGHVPTKSPKFYYLRQLPSYSMLTLVVKGWTA